MSLSENKNHYLFISSLNLSSKQVSPHSIEHLLSHFSQYFTHFQKGFYCLFSFFFSRKISSVTSKTYYIDISKKPITYMTIFCVIIFNIFFCCHNFIFLSPFLVKIC